MENLGQTTESYDRSAVEFALKTWDIDLSEQRQRFLGFMPREASGVLLDLGCGPGRDTLAFRELGYQVVGADLSAGMLAEAWRRVPEGRFVRADMLHLPFASESFSGVWACASFLHLPRATAEVALAEIRRVLSPSGALFLSVKRGKGEEWRVHPENGLRFFFTYYLPTRLWNMVEDAGFEVKTLAENVSPTQLEMNGEPTRWINLYAIKDSSFHSVP